MIDIGKELEKTHDDGFKEGMITLANLLKMAAKGSDGFVDACDIDNALSVCLGEDRTESDTEEVKCIECEHLMFSDMYGECSKGHRGIVRPDDSCKFGKRKAENEAKEALEKQIPMKARYSSPFWYICPKCGGSITIENIQEHICEVDTTYCEHCGQALDWSEDDGE